MKDKRVPAIRIAACDVAMARILLVEDNEMNRDMLSRRLLRRGYDVLSAADGEEGVATAHAHAPDIILMDMSLPRMDGWEAARRLKSNAQTQALPIIALTAHSMPGDREKALEAGCDDYDTKPIDFTSLIKKIDALLSPRNIRLNGAMPLATAEDVS